MKQLFLASVLMLLSITIFAQTPVSEYRVANATTNITVNLSIGSKIYNIATREYWVANSAITAGTVGVPVTIATEGGVGGTGKLTLLTQIKLGDIGGSTIAIKTTPSADVDAPSGSLITLPGAVGGVTLTAGLISGADKKKLDDMTAGVGLYTVESTVMAGGVQTVTLAHEPKNVTSIMVSVNGVPLKRTAVAPDLAQYSYTTTTVTIVPTLLENDVVTVAYTW